MNINFGPRGIVEINDARIIYRNIEGRGDQYNREGERNFAVVITGDDIAQALIDAGYNVKTKPPRNEDEDPLVYLPVKVKFNDRGPNIYIESGKHRRQLVPETAGIIDQIDILSVDMDIRPFHWEVNGKTGITAYLSNMLVRQRIDRFAADMEASGMKPAPKNEVDEDIDWYNT